jgi:pimeloyl-ACP methyl ester carboxylesterase
MDKSIEFGGARAFYRVQGKGKTVVLLHGFVEEGSMWNDVVKELQQKYQVIVPDLPGFGNSPLADSQLPLTMEVYAGYVWEILKQEKVKHVILLGHSMGGYITLFFAEKYAAMLKGFGLLNSHCFADTDEKKKNRRKGIAFIKKYGTRHFVTELYNSIFHESFKKKNQKLVDTLATRAQQYSAEAVMKVSEAMMNRKGQEEVLKNAAVPVLLINGKQDESAPLAYTLKQAALAPQGDVHFFNNCKHMCMFEREEETLQIILNFCDRAFS